ncbi:receptor-like protein 12 [Gossypium australe]|uniref:Receptor-like protein 12 n=1 Tax=Gossypium australe TaxID=47621 RepID=A0A5B6WYM7_9ROSI|nr:receptor-like protein 12 [Gossypium australe]
MLEKLEQIQKDMQDQLQAQLQDQLTKSTVINSGDDNEDLTYPPGFTPVNIQSQPDTYPQRVPVNIRPQQYYVDTSRPVNYLTGSGSNLGDNPTNLVVPDLDDMEEMNRARVEMPK